MKRIAILCALLATQAFAADPPQPVGIFDGAPMAGRVSKALEDGDEHGRLADKALDAMVKEAARQLKKHPETKEGGIQTVAANSEAEQILRDWETFYRDTLSGDRVLPTDVGDHKPMSQWLADLYAKLEKRLPTKILELTHLRDIWVMNFTIPVVLRPKADADWCKAQLARHPQDTCQAEYTRHFAGTKWIKPDPYATQELHHGFSGVVAFWVTWGACTVATWGMDFSLVCGPAGALVQRVTERRIGPKVSARIWARRNK